MKYIQTFSALCVGFFLMCATTFASFTDVSTSHSHHTAIDFLQRNNVINGYSDGTFRPNNTINRAELVKMILEGSNIAIDAGTLSGFPDVPAGEWYAPYVTKAKNLDAIGGYPDGTFKPAQAVNKVEALKIILNLMIDSDIPPSLQRSAYSDVDFRSWYNQYVLFAEQKNILFESGATLGVNANITRGEVAEYIYRIMKINESGADAFSVDLDKSNDNEIQDAEESIEDLIEEVFSDDTETEEDIVDEIINDIIEGIDETEQDPIAEENTEVTQSEPVLMNFEYIDEVNDPDGFITETLRLHNVERNKAGLADLQLNQKLLNAARRHLEDMAQGNGLDHTGSDGTTVVERVEQTGYDYRAVGENIALGQQTPAEVMESWLGSTGHRENILGENYTEIGIWYGRNGENRIVWVVVFGDEFENL